MKPLRVEDRFETVDGSRPDATPLDEALARRYPLPCFHLLEHGDAFDPMGAGVPKSAADAARALAAGLTVRDHGAPQALVARVRTDAARLLHANEALTGRLCAARPLVVELLPPGARLTRYGFPAAAAARISGLFWDHPDWPCARIALRQERLAEEPHLVFHELAHAVHYLAFTRTERDALYRLLLPTYRSRAAADEVFAIYSEREFVAGYGQDDLRAPGVYGRTRARWDEGHVLTRFVRNLYLPHLPLARPRP